MLFEKDDEEQTLNESGHLAALRDAPCDKGVD